MLFLQARWAVLLSILLVWVVVLVPQAAEWGSVVASAKPAVVWVLAEVGENTSSGSGVVISSDGFVLTAYHVVEGSSKITVVIEQSRAYEAQLIKADEKADVAVLKISGTGLFWLPLGDSDEVAYEEEVRVLGFPLPEHGAGYIAVPGRIQGFRIRDGVRFLQHDASTEAGHSGGPVVNAGMEVVGVHLGFIKGDHSSYTLAAAVNSVKGLVAVAPGSAPSPPAAPVTQRARVLLDQTRNVGVGSWSYFSSRVSQWFGTTEFVKHLTALGYAVENLDRWPITDDQLARAAVVVIFGPEYGFKASEIEVLVDFVASGGGLFLGFQQMKLEPGSSWGTAPIARAFGADFRVGGNIADSRDNHQGRVYIPKISDFIPHPITTGVSGLWFQGAVVVPPSSGTILARSGPNSWLDRIVTGDFWGNGRRDRDMYGVLEEAGPLPTLVAFEYGKGRVVLAGDSSFMINDWIKELSAKTLAGNTVDWLARRR